MKITPTNNLKILFPEVAKEWHPSKNVDLKPENVAKKSGKKVWWLCPKGHEYETKIANRTIGNTGCPECWGRKVSKENNLKICFPEIAKEWHPTRNGELKPEDVPKSGTIKVWWLCKKDKDHEWEGTVNKRTMINIRGKQGGCPFCSGSRPSKTNNLKTLFPHIAKEWHPTRNGDLKPEDVSKFSSARVWWLCPNNHEWQATVDRRGMGMKCRKCNSLGFLFPELAKEFHPTKNGSLKTENLSQKTGRIVWWLCPKHKEHEWQTSVFNRTGSPNRKETNCPKCANQSSQPEMRILSELETIFKEVISRHRFDRTEIDILVKDLNIGIEYDGSYHHRHKKPLDQKKNDLLKKHLTKLIRVRCKPLEKLNSDDILVKKDQLTKNDLNNIINPILNFCNSEQKKLISNYLALETFANEKSFRKYLSYFPAPIPSRSLATTHPKLVKEWDYEKNHPLKPEMFSFGSNYKVWWKCLRHQHEWKTNVGSRTDKKKNKTGEGSGCPKCFRLYRNTGRFNSEYIKLNNLALTFPKIAKEWHPTKNGDLKPNLVAKASHKKVWWLCSRGHKYSTTVSHRTSAKPTGCLECYYIDRG
jgi:very-short-patch-repair endonuclease